LTFTDTDILVETFCCWWYRFNAYVHYTCASYNMLH